LERARRIDIDFEISRTYSWWSAAASTLKTAVHKLETDSLQPVANDLPITRYWLLAADC
jgi:hypothetical protein